MHVIKVTFLLTFQCWI